MRTLIKKGIKNPQKIPPYLIGKLFPSLTRSHWRSGDEVRFREGGYVTHANNRPEFAASIYYELGFFEEVLPDDNFSHVLEVGCGYGRLSPWISEYASDYVGIDINAEALNMASNLHPNLSFQEDNIAEITFDKNSFDLVVSNTVLHHIPPDVFQDAVSNISRIITANGTFCMAGVTEGPGNNKTWVRSEKEYEDHFAKYGFTMKDTVDRDLPWRDSTEWVNTIMCFER